jgi:hypothetical protein
MFFQTLFDKMHLSLTSIHIEKMRLAESHLECIKQLLEFKEGQEAFVKSPNFLPLNATPFSGK